MEIIIFFLPHQYFEMIKKSLYIVVSSLVHSKCSSILIATIKSMELPQSKIQNFFSWNFRILRIFFFCSKPKEHFEILVVLIFDIFPLSEF